MLQTLECPLLHDTKAFESGLVAKRDPNSAGCGSRAVLSQSGWSDGVVVRLPTRLGHPAGSGGGGGSDVSELVGLGHVYTTGQCAAKDEVSAVKWFRKAAERGDSTAQYNLGVMSAKGTGVLKDER